MQINIEERGLRLFMPDDMRGPELVKQAPGSG